MRSFLRYWWRFLVQFGAECYHTWRAELLSTAAVALVTYLLTHSSDAQAKGSLKTALLSVAIVLGCFALYHLVRAAWRIHQDQELTVKSLTTEKDDANRELKKWQSVSPEIDIQIGAIIASRPLETGVQGLFLLVDLTLIEPAEVQIDTFKLEIVEGVGIQWEAMWVDDLEDWTRLIKDPEKYRMVNYQKAARKLTQRGDKTTCCLHFFFMMKEAKLSNVDLVLKVVTPHGTRSAQTKGLNAFPNLEKKGRMVRRDSDMLRNLRGF